MVFIIAEAGVNHNGDIGLAHQLVKTAAERGANAVKFQAFKTNLLCRPGAQADMLRPLELADSTWPALRDRAHALGMAFIMTPFDEQSLEAIAPLADYIKIGSGDVGNHQLLRQVGSKRKPVILSTGMSTMSDVQDAIHCLTDADSVSLLHCVSAYPAPADASNLAAMGSLRRFNLPVGWSDHTGDDIVTTAAVALGAEIIEAHLTLDNGAVGPDHICSLDPEDFGAMVHHARIAALAIGSPVKRPQACEYATMAKTRRGADGRRA